MDRVSAVVFLCIVSSAVASAASEPWNRTIEVPFTEQPNDYTCGPTSLSMLMAFAGKPVSVTEICDYLGGCPSAGIGESTVEDIARHFGFSGVWNTDDEHLTAVGPSLHYCDGGSAYIGTYGHYIVTNGFVQETGGDLAHCVVTNDPARSKNTHYDALSFVSVWDSPNGKYRYFTL